MYSKILLAALLLLVKTSFCQTVTATLNIPASANPGTDMIVEVSVNKGSSNGFMKYFQEIPAGFTAVDIDSKSGSFTYADNGVKIVWITPPSEPTFVISYKINVPASATGTKSFTGKVSYIQENERMAYEIPPVTVSFGGAPVASIPKAETPKPEVKVETPKPVAETPKPEVVKTETPVIAETPKSEVVKTEVPKAETPKPVITKVEPTKTEIVANEKPTPTPKPVVVVPAPNKIPVTAAPQTGGKSYRVQIGAYNLNPVISNVLEISKVTLDNGMTKYFSGNFTNYDDAVKRKNEVTAKGFPGAFIVQFVDGKIVK